MVHFLGFFVRKPLQDVFCQNRGAIHKTREGSRKQESIVGERSIPKMMVDRGPEHQQCSKGEWEINTAYKKHDKWREENQPGTTWT